MQDYEELKGAIKYVLYVKNFGFIKGDDGDEYFFHVHDITEGRPTFDRLSFGDRVKFFKSSEQRAAADGKNMAYAAIRVRVQ